MSMEVLVIGPKSVTFNSAIKETSIMSISMAYAVLSPLNDVLISLGLLPNVIIHEALQVINKLVPPTFRWLRLSVGALIAFHYGHACRRGAYY